MKLTFHRLRRSQPPSQHHLSCSCTWSSSIETINGSTEKPFRLIFSEYWNCLTPNLCSSAYQVHSHISPFLKANALPSPLIPFHGESQQEHICLSTRMQTFGRKLTEKLSLARACLPSLHNSSIRMLHENSIYPQFLWESDQLSKSFALFKLLHFSLTSGYWEDKYYPENHGIVRCKCIWNIWSNKIIVAI